jgi:glycine oxidase
MSRPEVAIVGGGVVGLSIAYELAKEGVLSVVFDRDAPGRAASWAGAGIIAPAGERPPRDPMGALRFHSATLFQEWSEVLLAETGIDNGYRRSGGVDVAATDGEELALRAVAGRWREAGIACERLAPAEFDRVEPCLARDLRVAYFLPDRAQVRNPRHLRALIEALEGRGVDVRAGEAVVGFEIDGVRVRGVRTRDEIVPCERVVVSAGPWTEGLLAPLGLPIVTPPVRGQIVLLRSRKSPLRRIVEHGSRYLVPRDDGRILVGSTEENVGFDNHTTTSAVRDLLDEALRLCPSLADAEVERAWAGLRPGSFDTRPYIGTAPGLEGLYVASGHRRAGLQLSPATAEVMADLVLGRSPRIDLDPFRLDREPALMTEALFRS